MDRAVADSTLCSDPWGSCHLELEFGTSIGSEVNGKSCDITGPGPLDSSIVGLRGEGKEMSTSHTFYLLNSKPRYSVTIAFIIGWFIDYGN